MDPMLAALFQGELSHICQDADGCIRADADRPAALLCGSFNPLHAGHRDLANVAARVLGVPTAFELTIVNADKAPLDATELKERLLQFVGLAPVWLTKAPTFAEKSQLFPGSTFVVGADTVERIVAPRFYRNSTVAMNAAFDVIRAAGSRFLVAGRRDAAGKFVAGESVALPADFRDLFDVLPESAFRHDVSSSDLRRRIH